MNAESEFRAPTNSERALLARLLDADFPGKDGLAPLLREILVKTIDEDGGLALQTQVEGKALVVQRVPVEAEGKDEDGVTIHMALHVVDGKPVELEFYREDPETVRRLPPASAFELIVLPPAPENGWPDYGPR